jgi:hypothetical protein
MYRKKQVTLIAPYVMGDCKQHNKSVIKLASSHNMH